jgi:hypothetical protein
MPDHDEEQFERYLKNFRPVDPEPFPIRAKGKAQGAHGPIALAVGVVASLAAAAVTLIMLPRHPQATDSEVRSRPAENLNPNEISMPILTNLALEDHVAFVELIDKKAALQFPAMKTEQSALRVLAKE